VYERWKRLTGDCGKGSGTYGREVMVWVRFQEGKGIG
jgi:hypothetical protein